MKIEKIFIPPAPHESRPTGTVGADGESDRHGGNAAYYGRGKKQEKEEDAVVFTKHDEQVEVQSQAVPSNVSTNATDEKATKQPSTDVEKKSLSIVV